MRATETRNEAQRFLLALLEVELLLDYRAPVLRRSNRVAIVTWPSSENSRGLVVPGQFGTVPEYRRMLQDQEYSAVLFDGSLLQLSWSFVSNRLTRHRLCYFPCPVELTSVSLDAPEATVSDAVDECLLQDFAGGEDGRNFFEDPPGGLFPLLRLRSPVRFDFDVEAAADDHPACHLTMTREECRIPVHGPVSLGHFVRLVFRNFFPLIWARHAFLRTWSAPHTFSTISAAELSELHIAWRSTM
jgi:hypothetical protein